MARKTKKKTLEDAFGQVLKESRAAKGISQLDLGFESDLDHTYISLLERGKRQPSLRTILCLANALDTTGPELVRRTVKVLGRDVE